MPVFVRGRSAWAEGVGEQLTPIELPPRWFVIVDPGVSVPTAELFAAEDLTRDAPRRQSRSLLRARSTGNAFAPVVRARFGAVARALDWLDGRGAARLSGSGGCVFAAVASREAGMAVVAECPPGMRGFVARGVSESALLARSREVMDVEGCGWGVAKW